jgi:hypothetical protein
MPVHECLPLLLRTVDIMFAGFYYSFGLYFRNYITAARRDGINIELIQHNFIVLNTLHETELFVLD